MCKGLHLTPGALAARSRLGTALNPNTRDLDPDEIDRRRSAYWVERYLCQTNMLLDLSTPLTCDQVERVETAWRAVIARLGITPAPPEGS